MNKHAQALGRLGKGKKKTLSKQEIQNRTQRLVAARKKRWPEKKGFAEEETGSERRDRPQPAK